MDNSQAVLHASIARRIAKLERRIDEGEDSDEMQEKLESLYDLRRESHHTRHCDMMLGKGGFGT